MRVHHVKNKSIYQEHRGRHRAASGCIGKIHKAQAPTQQ